MNFNKEATVWQLAILDLTENRVWCGGLILKGNHEVKDSKTNAFKNAIHVVQSYFVKVYAHQKICIHSNNEIIETQTDAYGRFQIITTQELDANLTITLPETNLPLKIVQEYPISFKEPQRTLDIISDIDDTIMVSNTAHFYKRIKTLLLLVPEKRAVIEFTQNMFKAWKSVNPRIFYVSKSESNLFIRLTKFIKHNNLPQGMLTLTPYLSFFQLIKGDKPVDFKLNAIRFLIENSRSKYYVLVGDDSQKDMAIYTEIVKAYPQLILKVYIRQTREKVNETQQLMWQKLKATGVSASYFVPEHANSVLNEIEDLKKELV
ncbi:App1 family protein [Tamlana sp. I1]|uniref:App1 family protein n=1 Tax=Tamlana sp. I1 TaxID=2762061 RepID=UPI00188FA9F3|nr:App1 family protein [Tamlana sp. I1]